MKNVKLFFKIVLAGATLVSAHSTICLILRLMKSAKKEDLLGFLDVDFPEDNSMVN